MVSRFIHYLEIGNYRETVIKVFILVIITFLFNITNKLTKSLTAIHQEKMKESLNHKLAYKLTKLPYQYIEDPYYLDLVERARFAVNNEDCITTLLTSFSDNLQYLITLSGLVTIMILFDFKLIFIVIFTALLNLILFSIFFKTQIKFYDDNLDINRKFVYYTKTISDDKNGKDFRIYPVGNLMLRKFRNFSIKLCNCYNVYLNKSFIIKSLMQLIKYVEMILIYIFIANKIINENQPISVFILYVSAALSFSTSISSIINTSKNFINGLKLVTPFVKLTQLQEINDSSEKIIFNGEFEELEFKNVSFSYPKNDDLILNNINFKIKRNEKISIVGLNGAGKTTLVKLLCRLYEPTYGEIILNGQSICKYEYNSYIKHISTIFQDFKLFSYSLKENLLADISDSDAYTAFCEVGLKEKIDSLSTGIHTIYSKSYSEEGVNLSGGESQKVALARALQVNSDLIILDEPTSALDPISEAEFYTKLHKLINNKTLIYISHRMSSSKLCDKILVINNGSISDFDSHENLMKDKSSLYYKLFMKQAENYAK